jgi:hypothetical protein
MLARFALLMIVVSVSPLLSQAKVQISGAGEVQVRYGMPIYREALIEQARPGLDWRMGANGPTVMETTAALVLEKGVIFPGAYTLTASCRDESAWDLKFVEGVVQGRGGEQKAGPKLPTLELNRTKIEKEADQTKKLEIELQRSSDKDFAKIGGANFQLRFGPHQLAHDFLCVGTTKKSLKFGKVAYELEGLKLPLRPNYEEVLLGKGNDSLTVGRMTLTKDEVVTELEVLATEEVTLRLPGWNKTLKGTRATGLSKANTMEVAVKSKTLTIKLGTTALEFDLDDAVFSKSETGGTTTDK